MIPPFDPETGFLPSGVYFVTWEEIAARFGWTSRRQLLLTGLRAVLDVLERAGCRRVYVGGSFVTAKEEPDDFDACWEAPGVNFDLLDPVLLDFRDRRAAQKAKYGGEVFPANMPATASGIRYRQFLALDSVTGTPKGIIAIELGMLR